MSLEQVKEGVSRSADNILQLRVMTGIFVFGFVVYGLFQIFNKTKILADKIDVTCHSTLLPFLFSKSVPADGILQVFVRPPKTKSFFGHLYAMDKNSHCTRLTSGMPSEIAAHQICHELQDFYGLEDLPVFGQNTLPHQPGPRP